MTKKNKERVIKGFAIIAIIGMVVSTLAGTLARLF